MRKSSSISGRVSPPSPSPSNLNKLPVLVSRTPCLPRSYILRPTRVRGSALISACAVSDTPQTRVLVPNMRLRCTRARVLVYDQALTIDLKIEAETSQQFDFCEAKHQCVRELCCCTYGRLLLLLRISAKCPACTGARKHCCSFSHIRLRGPSQTFVITPLKEEEAGIGLQVLYIRV